MDAASEGLFGEVRRRSSSILAARRELPDCARASEAAYARSSTEDSTLGEIGTRPELAAPCHLASL